MMQGSPIEILLVEDNPGDVLLTRKALAKSKILNHLQVAEDGEKALQMLRRQGPYAEATRPDLILLDLNLPGIDGREVLTAIKTDGSLKRIPVIILTTSSAEEDILRTYSEHANCYITKPIGMNEFFSVISTLEDFWFTIVKLPPNGAKK